MWSLQKLRKEPEGIEGKESWSFRRKYKRNVPAQSWNVQKTCSISTSTTPRGFCSFLIRSEESEYSFKSETVVSVPMDVYGDQWLISDIEMDNEGYDIFHQCQMGNSFDNLITQDMSSTLMGGSNNQSTMNMFYGHQQQTASPESYSFTSFEATRPSKQFKNSCNSTTTVDELVVPLSASSSNPSSQFLSFANNVRSPPLMEHERFQGVVGNNNVARAKQGNKRVHQEMSTTNSEVTTRPAQCHIMAERKRREKLNQKFIALSAIVPGLKKMDKASVLGDAIKHVKHLQEKVNLLEEQTKKRTIQSAVYVNKSQVICSSNVDHDEDKCSSSADNHYVIQSNNSGEETLPEIQTRVSDKNVLIRILCEKNKGVIGKVVEEIEKLHLSVSNSSVLPFGSHAIDMTIVAQMENEYCIKARDLVKSLRLAFLKFI